MKAERESVMKSNLIKTSVITTLCLVATCAMSMAQSTWLGLNQYWNDTANWSGNVLPEGGETIYFGSNGSNLVNRNIASNTNSPQQIIFSKGASAYTFEGNRIRLNTTGLRLDNYSGKTQTFSSGLEFASFGGYINTASGDVIVENGLTGGNNKVPIKDGIGTLTINGTSNVQLGVYVNAGTLSLDKNAESFGGVNNVVFNSQNTSVYEIRGATSGTTIVSKTVLTLNAGYGTASKIRLKSNGGDGVELHFGGATSALSNLGLGAGSTFNLDISSSAGNKVTFASIASNNASLTASGIHQWATVTDATGKTGFATLTDTTGGAMVRNTNSTVFDGGMTVSSSTNYRATGDTTLTNNRSVGSMTIDAASGGEMSGAFSLTTGGLLMQEGSKDYTITSAVLPLTSSRLYIHQYSMAGDLILNGLIHTNTSSGFLAKTGAGTLVVGAGGVIQQSSATLIQEGRFVLNGVIQRSAEVRVFDKATLEGSGSIGTQAASAVKIYGGGILAGSTSGALNITGTLTLDSYSHFKMTLDSTSSDFVSVSGAVTLSSDVNLKLALTNAPVLAESVLLLKGSTVTGEFATINGSAFGPDGIFSLDHGSLTYTFQILYGNDEVRIEALSVIPEPSAVLLAGMGVASLLIWGRRRFAVSKAIPQ